MMPRMLGIRLTAATVLLAVACSDDGLSPAPHGPTLLEAVSPAGGTGSVTVGSTISVTFSHAMMPGMEMLAVLHEGSVDGPEATGSWNWSADRTRLTFTPAQPLKSATRYTLHLGGGMKDAWGRVVDMQQYGTHLGGQWATGGMMGGGGMMGNSGGNHPGPDWQHANGSYGMTFSFTTSG